MIIDFHTHNFPDSIAKYALEVMVGKLGGMILPVGDGTLKKQLADLDRHGVDKAVMCPVATKPTQADIILQTAIAIRDGEMGEEASKRIIPFASVYPASRNYIAELTAIANAGIKGIKIHPYYQNFSLNDPRIVPFFEVVRDLNLIVISHCGFDLGYKDAPMSCGPNEIAKLFERVPNLASKFIAAHLGGFSGNPDHSTDILLESGCFIDSAVIMSDVENKEASRICATWPAERMLFATDYPWASPSHHIEWLKKNRPNESEQRKIFGENAEKLLGLKV